MAKRDHGPTARASGEGVAAVYLHVDELRPNPRNPRAHGDEVVRLARTILRTTWGAPIIAQASTRRIIGGHGRLEAARMILDGLEVDGILRGGAEYCFDRDAPGPGLVPVRLVDVSDAEADAMTLADNARALQGTDDAAAVVAMATASFERDADVMRDMGYGAEELDALVKQAGDDAIAASKLDLAAAFGALPDGDKQPFQQMTFTLHDSQVEVVRRALDAAKDAGDFDGSPNENSNGNALHRIAEAFLG